MPEYRAVRKHHSLLDICRTPDLAAEVTITAAERLGVDAAIIFADLLLPFTPMGLDFEFVADEGPRILAPIRTAAQARALRIDRTGDLIYVARAIEKVAAHFAGAPRLASETWVQGDPAPQDQLGIIGFCGAPFTLASYAIEGGSSRNYIETKRLMYASQPSAPAEEDCHPERPTEDCHPERSAQSGSPASLLAGVEQREVEGPRGTQPLHNTPDLSSTELSSPPAGATAHNPDSAAWPILMSKLVTVLADYAAQQVAAGADVIQVFDSWAGALSPTDYRQYVLAPTTDLIRRIRALGVPVIYFGVDTASLLPAMRETTADVLGLDWRTPLDQAWSALDHAVAVQGNLDPIALFAPPEVLHARVAEVLAAAAGRPGHIFNLGHGIVPSTPVDAVLAVVNQIKNSEPASNSATVLREEGR
jgi:uroporphyrinogen decarboxylase